MIPLPVRENKFEALTSGNSQRLKEYITIIVMHNSRVINKEGDEDIPR